MLSLTLRMVVLGTLCLQDRITRPRASRKPVLTGLAQIVICKDRFFQLHLNTNTDLDFGKPEPAADRWNVGAPSLAPPVNLDDYTYTGSILLARFLHILEPEKCRCERAWLHST